MKPASYIILILLAALPALAAPGSFTLSGSEICWTRDPPPRPGTHLDWTASANAVSYDVFRDGVFRENLPFGSAGSFEETNNSMSPGQTISYFLVAHDSVGGTTQSNTINIVITGNACQPPPAAPVLDGSAACDPTGPRAVVNLSWSGSPTATSYRIARSPSAFPFPVTTTSTSYTDTTVNPGVTYSYRVTASNSGGSTDSNIKDITISESICPPATPTASATPTCVAGPPTAPAVHVSWTPAAFAASYVVNRGGSPISGTLSADTTSFDDVNVAANQTYTYTVTASNASGSATSAPVQATVAHLPCLPNPPGAFSAAATASCDNNAPVVHVSWSTSSGATSFVINRDGMPISGSLPASTPFYNDNDVVAGHTYGYTVTATNDGGSTTSSPASVSISSTICGAPPPPPPSAFTASSNAFCNGGAPAIHLSWTAASGATSYVVNRNGSPISGTLSSGTMSFDDTGVTIGQSYAYAIVASNSGGSTSAIAGTITPSAALCPPPAFTLSAIATCNPIASPPIPMVTLNWSAAATATSYLILRDSVQIGSVGGSATSFNDADVSRGQTHVYVVRALGPGGSTDSNAVTLTIDSSMCTGTTCTFSCATTVPASAVVTAAVHFALQQPPSCSSIGATWTFGDNTFSTDLAPSHTYSAAGTYHWTVFVGSDAAGTCQSSGTITITAPPAPPMKHRAVRH